MNPTVYRWTELATDTPMPLLDRRRIIGTHAMISHVHLKRGCDVPMHAHENEQFAIVVSGRLRFTLPNADGSPPRVLVLTDGEVLHLPSNAPHAAYAEAETIVIDIFSPPSEKTGIDRG